MNMKIINNQKGDTIMEVLICVAMLGFMLGSAFTLTNRNQLSARASQERSEGVRLAEKQIEYLRTYYAKHNPNVPVDLAENFCFTGADGEEDGGYSPTETTPAPNWFVDNDRADGDTGDNEGNYINECKQSPNGYTYRTNIWKANSVAATSLGAKPDTYVVTVRWDNVKGGAGEEVKVYYSVDQLVAGLYGGALAVGGGIVPPPPPPTPPVPATISQSSYSFRSWHLLNTGGAKHTQVFTVTNPSPSASLNLTNITGTNSTFSVTSNGCSGITLTPSATCNFTAQFYPPSGGVNNRLSNAGYKTATLTVNNSNGVASTSTVLSGKAYSDQAGPGDVITGSTQGYLHSYNNTCYNNVEACGSEFTGIAGNGNLYLGGTYCAWGGWGAGGYGNYSGDANKLIPQTDGNLVFYDPYTYRYASWTYVVPDLWLKIQDGATGGVYLASGSSGPVYKWIHYDFNGNHNAGEDCFRW